jgi:hypothetical protein
VPVTSIVFPTVFTVAPIAAMQANELSGSAPVEKFVSREVPAANPASIAYRCEIDLSPGNITDPRNPRAGATICVVISAEDIPPS